MKWLRRFALSLAALTAAYLLATLVGSHWPVNRDWLEAESGITVYVASNGYHTGIVVPAQTAEFDWDRLAPPLDLGDPSLAGQWLLFGWGDREFYLNTPTWAEFDIRTGLIALTGSGSTLVHVDHMDRPDDAVEIRPITLTPGQYRRLAAFIAGTFTPGAAIKGYTSRDLFYPARGRYSLFRTCNAWTGEALAAAGVRIGLWTPFEGGVMRWFRAPPVYPPPTGRAPPATSAPPSS